MKISVKKLGAIFDLVLKISVISNCRFCLGTETEFSFVNRALKPEKLSLYAQPAPKSDFEVINLMHKVELSKMANKASYIAATFCLKSHGI